MSVNCFVLNITLCSLHTVLHEFNTPSNVIGLILSPIERNASRINVIYLLALLLVGRNIIKDDNGENNLVSLVGTV